MLVAIVWSILAGIVAGTIYTLSPLAVWVAAGAWLLVRFAGRGLSSRESTWLRAIILTALALRVVVVAALFLASPHDDQGAGILFGDEAYTHARAVRMRNIALGFPAQKIDYVLAFEEYGWNGYIGFVATAYRLFGPSPYGLRLLNSLVFIGGAVLLYRVARRAYGPLPAFGALTVLLFLPTPFIWSIALLKEPLYFGLTALIIAAMVVVLRSGPLPRRIAAASAALGVAWFLQGLRAGAGSILAASAALTIVVLVAMRTAGRAVAAASVALVAIIAVLWYPPTEQRALAAVQQAAVMHAGHVFTVGHPYKLLDDAMYVKPRVAQQIVLTADESARFVLRAIVSFVTVPLPWQIATRGELVLLPEQLVWYALVLLVPVGIVAAFRRDAIVTSVLLGQALTAAAAVAFTNGNVGTLIRFRGLVTPYAVWIGAVGFCTLMSRLSPRLEDSAR